MINDVLLGIFPGTRNISGIFPRLSRNFFKKKKKKNLMGIE
jgi:hypothetical protein